MWEKKDECVSVSCKRQCSPPHPRAYVHANSLLCYHGDRNINERLRGARRGARLCIHVKVLLSSLCWLMKKYDACVCVAYMGVYDPTLKSELFIHLFFNGNFREQAGGKLGEAICGSGMDFFFSLFFSQKFSPQSIFPLAT